MSRPGFLPVGRNGAKSPALRHRHLCIGGEVEAARARLVAKTAAALAERSPEAVAEELPEAVQLAQLVLHCLSLGNPLCNTCPVQAVCST